MKNIIYLLSGIIFGLGLALSGMIDPLKVKGFLAVTTPAWNPALIFVLGSAVVVYFIAFQLLRFRKKSLNGEPLQNPSTRPLSIKLLLGAAIFGIGWGLVGICPGPAIVHMAFLDKNFALFLVAMFAGIELNARLPFTR